MNNNAHPVAELMQESGVGFGTSGARGLVSAMTDRVCYAYTLAFLQHLNAINMLSGDRRVAIAGDYRPSTPLIMKAVGKAVEDFGCQLIHCGSLPSPAIALFGIVQQIPTIMVTGSHIPDDRNGIKFNRPDGEILKQDEAGIRGQQVEFPEGLFDEAGAMILDYRLPEIDDQAGQDYLTRYREFFDSDTLTGLKIGLYQHSGVARELLIEILQALGAEVLCLGYSEAFVPVDTEAIRPEDVALANDWASEFNLDAIVSTDGDADRPLVSDEQGRWLRGDIAGLLCADYLNAEWVVTPVSSNSALEHSGKFRGVVRTRIGSPYVIADMQALIQEGKSRVVGYEANGGFLIADDLVGEDRTLAALPTRDAVIVILAILHLSKVRNKPVSGLLLELPERYTHSDRLKAFPTELSQQMLGRFQSGDFTRDSQAIEEAFKHRFGPVDKIDTTDGVRITFSGGDIVHLRPSGNAPELRCYTESDSEQKVRDMNRDCLKILEEWRVN
ncbi:MAG: phosphomannomutase [Candidatus Thiodiazotropha sp.]